VAVDGGAGEAELVGDLLDGVFAHHIGEYPRVTQVGYHMRIGIFVSTAATTLDAMTEQVAKAAHAGLDSAYFPQVSSWDALTTLSLIGRQVPNIALGTAVIPTYPRHPLALAAQALSAQAATGNRLTLGIGPSHPSVIEGQFGYSYDRPARHIREYLSALRPLLAGEQVDYHGETLVATGQVEVPGANPPEVLLSALGPVMLRLAGQRADGTVTVWTTADTIASHIAPTITLAASEAGRPAPRIVTVLQASVTTHPNKIRQQIAERLGGARELPSYRALLDRQGMVGVQDTVVAGGEQTVAHEIRKYAEAGTTELLIGPVGEDTERNRTLELLSTLREELA
jgi:F420-dependent oxidoreductase-like protein